MHYLSHYVVALVYGSCSSLKIWCQLIYSVVDVQVSLVIHGLLTLNCRTNKMISVKNGNLKLKSIQVRITRKTCKVIDFGDLILDS